MTPLVGDMAPGFTLTDQFGQPVILADFRGKRNVVLMFYPFAFSRTCTDELSAIRDRYIELVTADSVVLSVSCDSVYTLKAFAEQEHLTHPMLSDFWPHGALAQEYGVFVSTKGLARRATFVIDKQGIVRWTVETGLGDVRSVDDYAAALADLS